MAYGKGDLYSDGDVYEYVAWLFDVDHFVKLCGEAKSKSDEGRPSKLKG